MRRAALTSRDGETLALRQWFDTTDAPRALILICHGLGEHAGRYEHVARKLNEWDFAVQAHDHYGHGESSGPRGGLAQPLRLLEDLAHVLDEARRAHAGLPIVLLGHSMGGLVAADFVARNLRPVDALVLSSPALQPAMSGFQKWLVAVMLRLAPGLRVGNGLNADDLSHDRAVVQAYRADRLNHDRISARLAHFLAVEGEQVMAAAPRWSTPTLLLYAGSDRLVMPEGSEAFARAAAPTGQVSARGFAGMFHELFNEAEPAPVFDAMRDWLDARFPASHIARVA